MSPPRSSPSLLGHPLAAWGLAAGLGVLGALISGIEMPLLTEETPPFTIWQAPVLLAFVLLGPRLGLFAFLLAFDHSTALRLWQIHPGVPVGSSIYLLEALAAWWLYQRARSLALAIALFWLGIGWALDWLIYGVFVGLEPDYVLMLFVKQLLNGVLYGAVIDLIAVRPLRALAARLDHRRQPSIAISQYAFRGGIVLAMLPVALVAVLYARAQFTGVLERETQRNSEMAFDVATRVHRHLELEHYRATDLLRDVNTAPTAEALSAVLKSYLDIQPYVNIVAMVDRNGTIQSAQPGSSLTAQQLAGQSVKDREYFQTVRDTRRTTYSNLIEGRFPMRDQRPNAAIVIAEPRLDQAGAFVGALLWSVDIVKLMESVQPRLLHDREVTLVDENRIVIGSNSVRRSSGTSLPTTIRPTGSSDPRDEAGIALGPERTTSRYYPPSSPTLSSRLGLNLMHAVFQPLSAPNWGVLIDFPATYLHELFRPTAYRIVALFGLLTLGAFGLVSRFAQRITQPVRSAAEAAQQVDQGRLDPGPMATMERSDLAEIRALAAALGNLNRSLQQQRRETAQRQHDLESKLLEAQKLEAVGLLAGGVAHDFNNLLTPILGYADLGAATTAGQEEREFFEKIREAARDAGKVTSQLLAFGRRQVLDMAAVDLVPEIEQCGALLRPLLRENIEVCVRIDAERAAVLVDTAQFHRILFNLALNAQDAMPSGGRLTVGLDILAMAPPGLDADHNSTGRYVVISISDTGVGIPQEMLGRIFDPFFSTKGPDKGTGLGLATVYGIVQQHGGTVDVESRLREGTSFRVYLPEVEAPPSQCAALASPEVEVGQKLRILLAEDDCDVRAVVTSFLDREGLDVSGHADAESLLEHFRREPQHFDALISDVVLPGMNGRELHDEVQQVRPGFPTLFISGYGHEVLARQGIPDGAQLLTKPFTQGELIACLRDLLGEPSIPREDSSSI